MNVTACASKLPFQSLPRAQSGSDPRCRGTAGRDRSQRPIHDARSAVRGRSVAAPAMGKVARCAKGIPCELGRAVIVQVSSGLRGRLDVVQSDGLAALDLRFARRAVPHRRSEKSCMGYLDPRGQF